METALSLVTSRVIKLNWVARARDAHPPPCGGMNLARGRELGIERAVDDGHDWADKPARAFHQGKTGPTGDADDDDDDGTADERAATHGFTSSSTHPDLAPVVSSSSSSAAAAAAAAARLHAFSAPLGRIARLDVANWMSQLVSRIADAPLHRLRLPGTHDSGAYHLSRTRMGDLPAWLRAVNAATRGIVTAPLTPFIAGWGEAQSTDAFGQLALGARYLDLRVVRESNGGYYAVHGMAGDSFENVLTQVASFLDAHPGEVVVCDCHHLHRFYREEHHLTFLDLIERTLGAHLVPPALRRASTDGDGTVTVRDCLVANRRCVCLYGGFDFSPKVAIAVAEAGCWERRERRDIWSPWPRAGSRRQLAERMRALEDAEDAGGHGHGHGRGREGFFVLQGVVTPDAKRIVKALTLPDWGRPRTLRDLATRVTPMVCRMVCGGSLRAMCIVMVDHIELADVEGWLLGAYGEGG